MSDAPQTNTLAIASLVFAMLAILGHGCCCLPIISYIAPFFVVAFEVLGLVLGLVAWSKRDPERGEPMAMVGIVASVVAMLMSLAYLLLFGGVILAYMVAVVAMVASGQ
jgi:hypothetical protein